MRDFEAEAKLTARLNEWSRSQERIDKLNARPGNGPKKAEHLKTLTDRLPAVRARIKTVR